MQRHIVNLSVAKTRAVRGISRADRLGADVDPAAKEYWKTYDYDANGHNRPERLRDSNHLNERLVRAYRRCRRAMGKAYDRGEDVGYNDAYPDPHNSPFGLYMAAWEISGWRRDIIS